MFEIRSKKFLVAIVMLSVGLFFRITGLFS